jgi:hypothetical protein
MLFGRNTVYVVNDFGNLVTRHSHLVTLFPGLVTDSLKIFSGSEKKIQTG